jgi:hypothetical protein
MGRHRHRSSSGRGGRGDRGRSYRKACDKWWNHRSMNRSRGLNRRKWRSSWCSRGMHRSRAVNRGTGMGRS